MSQKLPDFLTQGEASRLFPVLSTTSKEGRTTSIVLACMARIDEFGASLLAGVGQNVGVRSRIDTFTEVVCRNRPSELKDRPDGLIVVSTGSREWRALVEAKIGSSELDYEQIEKYRVLAKANGIDCLITISNQFATSPEIHPIPEVNKSRSKVPVFHWSWMHVLTEAEILLNQESVTDKDQRLLLNELRRFLTHDSAGVQGFTRMPKEWSELNKLVSSGGVIPAKSQDAVAVVASWHQETRDLALILSRMTERHVSERLSRKNRGNPQERIKEELTHLREYRQLISELDVPDAASSINVVADLSRRTIDVGMTIRAPEDRVSTKAKLNWLLKQIKTTVTEDCFIRLLWPGKAESTQYSIQQLRDEPNLAGKDREHLVPHSFHVFYSKRSGARFTQQSNFIVDLETVVPDFYREIGSDLTAWQPRAPRIKAEKSSAEDVSADGISEAANDFNIEDE
ncbi:MAG: hypothetical protein AAFR98_07940 [Pseudomonadota bacterium]